MKAPLVLAFLCILALCYLAWAQQQELVTLAEEVADLRIGVNALEPKPAAKPRTRKPAAPKETK